MDEKATAEWSLPDGDLAELLRSDSRWRPGAESPQQASCGLPSDERIQNEISFVLSKSLSPDLERWIESYNRIGQRNQYLWKWCHQGVEVTTLPCTPPEARSELCETKVLGVMIDVLLDDVADQGGDREFLDHLLTIPFADQPRDHSRFSADKQEYARFTADVWAEVERRVRRYPHYSQYADLLRFDYQQLFNVMRYSRLLNHTPALLNLVEHDLYLPHNMHMMVSSTIDLMCSPDFDALEIGKLREAVWYAQCMGRIGNLITTWQRELGEGDFTSGVFAYLVSQELMTVRELQHEERSRIESVIQSGKCEEHFIARWHECRHRILAMQRKVRSVNLRQFVAGLERLICLHLGSRGYK